MRLDIGEQARLVGVENCTILFRNVEGAVRVERVVYGGRDTLALFADDNLRRLSTGRNAD